MNQPTTVTPLNGASPDVAAPDAGKENAAGAMSLAWAITTASRLQGKEVERLRLHDAVSSHADRIAALAAAQSQASGEWEHLLEDVAVAGGAASVEWYDTPDPARLPALTWLAGQGWALVRSQTPGGDWVLDLQGRMFSVPRETRLKVARLVMPAREADRSNRPAFRLFRQVFMAHKGTFLEGAAATVIVNLLALAASLFSMQVYDRVIPTQGYSTLWVLTIGVMIAMGFEMLLKLARSYLMEQAIVKMDTRLSREIFRRLLGVRLDQLPGSVGSLSAQLRGYETIRGFLSASTLYLLVDAPFGLVFIFLIGVIAAPQIGLIPLVFLILCIAFGLLIRHKVDQHALKSTAAGNLKTGLLVETIEGAETIKAGGGSWGVLSKWIDVTDEAIRNDLKLRSISEKSSYISATMQQVSYVALVAAGAYLAAEGQLTMGSLIACSILSGRALAPAAQIPGLMVQFAHAKAALAGLEKVFALQSDNHSVERPLLPERISGQYALERVRFSYPGAPQALAVQQLTIRAGEKVAIIGPVGAGKSTLLRLLSGMYQPSEGRILLDGLDVEQISRDLLSDRIGYLQQEHRLFSGTLRENLLVGIADPGDEGIKAAATRTGLMEAISSHPKGLDLPIAEGGRGLSGGQRQLVAMTRLLLSKPDVWLLDEPTASMDERSEQLCMQALQQQVTQQNTVVLVTHKSTLLGLVDRIVVVANHEVVLDGPRDEVLKRLSPAPVARRAA